MKQEINCQVRSCKYHDKETQMCQLQSILVSPVNGKNTKNTDESMCASYEYHK